MRLRDNVYFYPDAGGLAFPPGFSCNTVLLTGRRHMLIDPGLLKGWPDLKDRIRADGLQPDDVGLALATHSHPDHVEAAAEVAAELKAQLAMSAKELDFMDAGRGSPRRLEDSPAEPPASELFTPVFSGPFRWEGREFRLIDAPGHSPGGLCLHWPERGLLVVGDAYFAGAIGAVDHPGGRLADLSRTVRILGGLRDVELVLCGHGPPVEGRSEVFRNYQVLSAEIAEKAAAGL
ncbi:MAG: MBL fold metallo-hydrolase [Deltaproteobacteria bacterium]|nr:MBL fold metallo-hydrolase [Deltaproteobacteria bacterium]